jgi:RNA polymerase sigma factor (sigma-70 family)
MPPSEDHCRSQVADADLLREMAAEPRGSESCKAAWEEFYIRHRKYLYGVCLKAHGERLGNGRVVELVQDTFVRAYERAKSYIPDDGLDEQMARWRVRGWLGRISENIMRDYFRREPQIVFMEEDELQARENIDPMPEDADSSQRQRRMEQAMETLTEREQDVLRVTAMWYRPGQRQQRLPNSVMTKLASSLNTTPDNVRQIRGRAIRKLKRLVETDSSD